MSANVVYCPRCGHPNPAGSQFCASCRANLAASVQPPHLPPQPPVYQPVIVQQRRGFPWGLCAIIAAVFLVLACAGLAVGGWFYGDQLIALLTGTPATPASGAGGLSVSGEGSLAVSSGQEGAVTAPDGARLEIPAGAVPRMDDGSEGTMVFSIEEDPSQTVSLPEGLAPAGKVYQMGPDGFTLELPVRIMLPIAAGIDVARVEGLAFYDAASSAWKTVPGFVDEQARTVSAYVTHFSPWTSWYANYPSHDEWEREHGGWIRVVNSHVRNTGSAPGCRYLPTSTFYGVCIQSYSLDDPEEAPRWRAPTDWQIGAYDEGSSKYWLPAGQYTLAEVYGISEINNMVGYLPCYWKYWRPLGAYTLAPGQTLEFQAPGWDDSGWTEDDPPCWGVRTTSVGTGDVQVTLTWHSERDIDLHVIDPNGDEVYYAQTSVPSGGQLDRDNKCADFILGRPENVFWPSGGAPSGTYTVKVHYYSDCGNPGAVEWTVRTVVMGQVNNYSGALSEGGDEQQVTTFTIP